MLDTSICVALLRGRAPAIYDRLKSYAIDEVAVSTITLAELQYGVARAARPQPNSALLAQFCAPLAILPFDSSAAQVHAQVRTALENQGTPIGPLDTLIGAHARAIDTTLVTTNEREFQGINNLRVESWMA